MFGRDVAETVDGATVLDTDKGGGGRETEGPAEVDGFTS